MMGQKKLRQKHLNLSLEVQITTKPWTLMSMSMGKGLDLNPDPSPALLTLPDNDEAIIGSGATYKTNPSIHVQFSIPV
jgi:long-subunit fatty acid transport protein